MLISWNGKFIAIAKYFPLLVTSKEWNAFSFFPSPEICRSTEHYLEMPNPTSTAPLQLPPKSIGVMGAQGTEGPVNLLQFFTIIKCKPL